MIPDIHVYTSLGYHLWSGPQSDVARIMGAELCSHYVCIGTDATGRLVWNSCTSCGIIGTLYTEVDA